MNNSMIPAGPSQPERSESPKSLAVRTEQDERVVQFMHRYGALISQMDASYDESLNNAAMFGIDLPPCPVSVFSYSQASETLKGLETGIPNELHGVQSYLKQIPSVLTGIHSVDCLFQAHYLKESLKHPDHDIFENEYQQTLSHIAELEQSAHEQGVFLSEASIRFWADSAHALNDRLYTWAHAISILEDIKHASLDRVVELQSLQGKNVQSASEYLHLYDTVRHEVENAMQGLPSMFDAMGESRGILNMGARRAVDAMREAEDLSRQETDAAIRAMNALNTVAQQALENADMVAEQRGLVAYILDLNELQFPIMRCWLELWNEMSRPPQAVSTKGRLANQGQSHGTFEEPSQPIAFFDNPDQPPDWEEGVINE